MTGNGCFFVLSHPYLHSGKLRYITMEKLDPLKMYIFPIEHGDIPASCVPRGYPLKPSGIHQDFHPFPESCAASLV